MRQSTATLLPLLVALGACSKTSYGDGIGFPKQISTRTVPRFAISQVYPSAAEPSGRFVQLLNISEASQALTNFALESDDARLELSSVLAAGQTIDSGGTIELAFSALGAGTAGEVALINPHGLVESYLAWGVDPAILQTSLYNRADAAEAYESEAFVRTGFPSRLVPEVAVGRIGARTGCMAPKHGAPPTEGDLDAAKCPVQRGLVVLRELLPAQSPETSSWVELENTTLAPLDLVGTRLCTATSCLALGVGATMAPQALLVVALGPTLPSVPAAAAVVHAGLSPLAAAGELALLAPGGAAFEAAGLLDYVTYGGTVAAHAADAKAQGLWTSDERAKAPRVSGESLSKQPALGAGVTAWDATQPPWNPSEPTPGSPNAAVGPPNHWTSCSYARPWVPARPVISLLSLSRATPERLSLVNRDVAAKPLADLVVAIDTADGEAQARLADLPHGTSADLAPGAVADIILDAAGPCTSAVCAYWAAGHLASSGAVALFDDPSATGIDASKLVAFVAWGSAPSSAYLQPAVDAGLWPGVTCALGPLEPGGALGLDLGRDGTSPADWL
jgi:hypothetical protein